MAKRSHPNDSLVTNDNGEIVQWKAKIATYRKWARCLHTNPDVQPHTPQSACCVKQLGFVSGGEGLERSALYDIHRPPSPEAYRDKPFKTEI